ncbi:hypothetical protein GCM10020001_005740 [Nonomuraea salmonea]
MKVTQAYRFALEPTPSQERALASHAGAARFAWNWGLAKCQERYAAEGKWLSGVDLHKVWNAEKKAEPGLAWWVENSKCVYQEAFRDLDRALRDFVSCRKGARKGRRLGFPRFKKRGKARDSFRFSTGVMRCAGGPRSPCRAWARSAHTSPPANWPGAWSPARRGSCRPPSPGWLSAGSSPSLSRSNERCPNSTPGPAARSALISA